jgi:hypothetical protein
MGQIIVSLPQGVFFPDGSRGTVTAVVLDGLPDGADVQASFRYQMDAPQPTTQKKPARRSTLSPAGKKAIAEAQRKRWAAQKRKQRRRERKVTSKG